MLQTTFGEATWLKGLHFYRNETLEKVASSDDLYESFQKAVDEDYAGNPLSIATIMKTWESQESFPVVTVSQFGGQLKLQQSQFMPTEKVSNNLWWIPISYTLGSSYNFSDTTTDIWIPGVKEVTIESEVIAKPFSDWVVVNIQQTGFYRVNYDRILWNRIFTQLDKDFEKIHHLNRAQLIDDSFHLAKAGVIGFEVPLSVIGFLEKEVSYAPWVSSNRVHRFFNRWLSGTKAHHQYQKFMRKNVEKLFSRLSVNVTEGESTVDRLARKIAIDISCELQLQQCLTETAKSLQIMLENDVDICPDIKTTILCNGLRSSDSSSFFSLQTKMLKTKSKEDRKKIIDSLGCTQNEALLTSFLYSAINENSLSNDERSLILSAAVEHGDIFLLSIIKFIRANLVAIRQFQKVSKLVLEISLKISTQEVLSEFKTLLDVLKYSEEVSQVEAESLKKSANKIINWQKENLKQFEDFFEAREKALESSTTSTEKTTESVVTEEQPTTLGASSVSVSLMVVTFSTVLKVLI